MREPPDVRLAYRELPPSAELAPYVTRFYSVRSIAPGAEAELTPGANVMRATDPLMRRLLPNADANLIFDLGEPGTWTCALRPGASASGAIAVGAMEAPTPTRFRQGSHLLGVALAVGASRSILAAPPRAHTGRIVELDRICDGAAHGLAARLVARLRGAASLEERVAVLEEALRERLHLGRHSRRCPGADRDLAAVLDHVTLRDGDVRVRDLASGVGLSRQTFTRWFGDAVGLGPKRFARLTRLQALLGRVVSGDSRSWARLAGEMGFYDQAHMIREFRWFTGLPPEAFLRSRTRAGRPAQRS